jgi:predicted DNA-binding transcriptional regulator YafY
VLAADLGVSIRSLYRDIATLQQQGANIEGEPGIGYRLKPGFVLPPLMFRDEEIEALILGMRWVAEQGDERLALAANDVLAKVDAVVPAELREALQSSGLLIGPRKNSSLRQASDKLLPDLRRAVRNERKIQISYATSNEQPPTQRIIWPIAVGFFEEVRVLVGWCELRNAFRHFRVDRIHSLTELSEPLPRRRRTLLGEWRKIQGIRGG